MQVRIHRGAAEIGGNCIEVEHDGARLVLDVGRPLSAGWADDVPAPPVPGFDGGDPSLVGVIVSHPHLDHYGLVGQIDETVPVFIGREAAALLEAAFFFSPVSALVTPSGWLENHTPLEIGPFTVTPLLVDHSAFDAYSLVIEAGGRRLFYSGDFRAHGHKRALFERLVSAPPRPVHTLLLEGTQVRAGGAADGARFETETELEHRLTTACDETDGVVALFGSAQNLDRLVTAFRAARRSGRELVVDLYGATVAAATRSTIPQPGFEGLRGYVPQRQRVKVKQAGEFERVSWIKSCRVFPEEMAAHPERFVLHVPSSTCRELVEHSVLDAHGLAGWSLWAGYLQDGSGVALRRLLEERNIRLEHLHTSGHASVPDLQRLVTALDPGVVVPIHSEATDRFAELFPRVTQRPDGTWWSV